MKKISIKKTAAIITFITLFSKMIGFIKNSVLAYYFGTGPVVDAYVETFAIGALACGWLAALVGNFTPVFHSICAKTDRKRALGFAANVFNCIFLITLILVGILELFAPQVVHFLAPGFTGETYNYTVHFFRLYLLSLVFYSIYRFSQEFLDCNQEHVKAAIPGLLISICTIAAIIISYYFDDTLLILGYVVAILLECILTQIWSHKIGFRYEKRIYFNSDLKTLFMMTFPIFFSYTLAEINTVVDKAFASNLQQGIVAGLEYANTMKDFAFQIGTIAVSTMLFPIISRLWAEGNTERFCGAVYKAINYMSLLYIPMIAGIAVLGDRAIDIVFRRGQFNADSAAITTNAFVLYSLGLIALSYRTIFFKAFYSMQKSKYVLLISCINIGLNIFLNVLLVKPLGYIGLAGATAISSTVCLPLFFILFKKAVSIPGYKQIMIVCFKSIAATTPMVVALLFLKTLLPNYNNFFYQFVVLAVMTVVGLSIYFLFCILFKVEEIKACWRMIVRRLTKR